jgi:hypothetical protein
MRSPESPTIPNYGRRRRIAGALTGLVLLTPSVSSCGKFLNSEPAITDSPIAPTVTATATITETPPSRSTSSGSGGTATLSQKMPEYNGYSLFLEPVTQRGNFFKDYDDNGTGKGDAIGPPSRIFASCIVYDPAFANDKSTHGLWYRIADEDTGYGGQYLATALTSPSDGTRYDIDVPPCDPTVTLPAPHAK